MNPIYFSKVPNMQHHFSSSILVSRCLNIQWKSRVDLAEDRHGWPSTNVTLELENWTLAICPFFHVSVVSTICIQVNVFALIAMADCGLLSTNLYSFLPKCYGSLWSFVNKVTNDFRQILHLNCLGPIWGRWWAWIIFLTNWISASCHAWGCQEIG